MKKLFLLTIFVFASCQTGIEPTRPVGLPENACDGEFMSLPDNLRDDRWLRVEDIRRIEQANKGCGEKVIEWGTQNYNIANRNYTAAKQNVNQERWFLAGVGATVLLEILIFVGVSL